MIEQSIGRRSPSRFLSLRVASEQLMLNDTTVCSGTVGALYGQFPIRSNGMVPAKIVTTSVVRMGTNRSY